MRAFYELIDYSPSTDPEEMGTATIRVVGCKLETEVDIPFGTELDDPTWQNYMAWACAGVLDAVDPGSRDYYDSLDNWANETPPWTPPTP